MSAKLKWFAHLHTNVRWPLLSVQCSHWKAREVSCGTSIASSKGCSLSKCCQWCCDFSRQPHDFCEKPGCQQFTNIFFDDLSWSVQTSTVYTIPLILLFHSWNHYLSKCKTLGFSLGCLATPPPNAVAVVADIWLEPSVAETWQYSADGKDLKPIWRALTSPLHWPQLFRQFSSNCLVGSVTHAKISGASFGLRVGSSLRSVCVW